MPNLQPKLAENRYLLGDQPFYIGRHRAGATIRPQDSLTRQHFHTGFELGGVVAGRGNLLFDGATFPIGKGAVFFVDPMLPHETWGEALDLVIAHLTRESIVDAHVDKGDLRLIEPFTGVRNGLSPVIADAHDEVETLLRAVKEGERGTPAGKQRAFLAVLDVIESVCERLERSSEGHQPEWKKNSRVAAQVLQFIHDNFAQEIGMAEIAAFTGMSVSTIAHLFKEYTGLSPIEFRNQVRITHAQERIKMTNETMSSIALSCGFNNTSQFYRMFRKFAGSAPAELRRPGKSSGPGSAQAGR